jgi:hypothetical protein
MSEMLVDYESGDTIRQAAKIEAAESREAAAHDGGAGVILVDGRRCYVEDELYTMPVDNADNDDRME